MGIFGNLFGNNKSKNNASQKIRGQFKDQKYFNKEITAYNQMIEIYKKDDIELIQKNGKLSGNQFLSYCRKYNKILECEYSAGYNMETLKSTFHNSLEYFLQGWSEDYQDYPLLLQMVCFGLLFEVPTNKFKPIVDFLKKVDDSNIEELWKPDSLIFFLIGQQDKKRKGSTAYEMLYIITQQPKSNAEAEIKGYLEKWYNLHKEEPWYNTHLRNKGYSGYWAWEVAAVVKAIGLDDSSFKENPFYPYDMVHWR